MSFLSNKRILITGLLSNRSIAYGIAKSCKREGAQLAFSYAGERFLERTKEFAEEFDSKLVYPCDVTNDTQISEMFKKLGEHWPQIDGILHSIAFASKEAISGNFLDGISRENFQIAHDISSYSFSALAKAAMPYLSSGASLLTITYIGSSHVVPNYNTMGLAKASLEASVRYLASSLGSRNIRVNAISSGPIKTLAASGIQGFNKILEQVAKYAPLKRNVTQDEVGNAAAFLLSDLASGITGEITYVDAGFSKVISGMEI